MNTRIATELEVKIELYLRERDNIEIPVSLEKNHDKVNIKEASNEDLYLYLEYLNYLSNQELII